MFSKDQTTPRKHARIRRNTERRKNGEDRERYSIMIHTMFVGRLVFLYCLVHASLRRYFALWALVWATHGLSVYRAPVYRGCPCRDPLECPSDAQAGWHREQSANPLRLCCVCGSGPVIWTSCIHAFSKHTSSTREVMLLSLRVAP